MTRSIRPLRLAILLGALAVPAAQAASIEAQADVSAAGLGFASSAPGATLEWLDEWLGYTAVIAEDSLGGYDDDGGIAIGDDEALDSAAATGLVAAGAGYAVSDGGAVAIDPSGTLTADVVVIAILSGAGLGASGEASVGFDNFFSILGGSLGAPVTAGFTLPLTGLVQWVADGGSFLGVDVAAVMQVYTIDAVGAPLDLLGEDRFARQITSDGSGSVLLDGLLAVEVLTGLQYGGEYWVTVDIDLIQIALTAVPAPGVLALLAPGLLLAVRRRREAL